MYSLISCFRIIYDWALNLGGRWTLQWNSWQPVLHGAWGSPAELWTGNWCLEYWCNPLYLALWSSSILGRQVSFKCVLFGFAQIWENLLLQCINSLRDQNVLFWEYLLTKILLIMSYKLDGSRLSSVFS